MLGELDGAGEVDTEELPDAWLVEQLVAAATGVATTLAPAMATATAPTTAAVR